MSEVELLFECTKESIKKQALSLPEIVAPRSPMWVGTNKDTGFIISFTIRRLT
jgi:hypothetical protein